MSNFDWLKGYDRDRLLDLNERVNKQLAHLIEGGEPDHPPLVSIKNILPDYMTSLGDGTRSIEGLSTGMEKIDELIGGLNRFVLVAARAGTGKSTLAIQLAMNTAAAEGVPILYYSYEMDAANVLTMMAQNLSSSQDYKLQRKEIILTGNNPKSSAMAESLSSSLSALEEIGEAFYIQDSSLSEPTLDRMTGDIERVAELHGKLPLVLIDSIQDLVKPDGNGATIAEAQTAQQIVEIQQHTGATFLAISQKAKGASLDDPYAGVLGSVAMIHKPTTVVELLSVYDLMRPIKDQSLLNTFRKLIDASDIPNPVIMRVIKGRNNGYGYVELKHYGRHAYFEEGRVLDFDASPETSLYDLNGL